MKHIPFVLVTWLLAIHQHSGVFVGVLFVKHGTVATLHCPVKSTAGPLLWFGPPKLQALYSSNTLINSELPQSQRIYISGYHKEGEYVLHIRNFSATDEGRYRCQGIAENAAFSRDIDLQIPSLPTMIYIQGKTNSSTIYVNEGEILDLVCSCISGNPPENITWFRDDEILNASGVGSLTHRFRTSKLDHQAVFECKVYHLYLTQPLTDNVTLYLYLIPEVNVVALPSIVLETSKLTLQCKVVTNVLPSKICWIYKESNIHSGYKLTLNNINREESGQYTCYVENKIGNASASLLIDVQYKPDFRGDVSELIFESELNHPVDLLIPIWSNPAPHETAWQLGTGGILNDWVLESTALKGQYILRSTIIPTIYEHFGFYTVNIINVYGTLIVNITLKQSDATIDIRPTYVQCKSSASVSITCALINITVATWTNSWQHYLNGVFVRDLKGTFVKHTSVLWINNCSFQDAGEYRCVWNETRRHSIASAVVSFIGIPFLTERTATRENESLILKGTFYSSHLPLNRTWLFNNKQLNDNRKYSSLVRSQSVNISVYQRIITFQGYTVSLKIFRFSAIDIGKYTCRLFNEYGKSDTIFAQEELRDILRDDKTYQQTTYKDLVRAHTSSYTIGYERTVTKQDNKTYSNGTWTALLKQRDVLIGFGILVAVIISLLTIILKIKWQEKKRNVSLPGQRNRDHMSLHEGPRLIATEPHYEEIESVYYHSVEWRDYSTNNEINRNEANTDLANLHANYVNSFHTTPTNRMIHSHNDYLEMIDDSNCNLSTEETIGKLIDCSLRESKGSLHSHDSYLIPCSGLSSNTSEDSDTDHHNQPTVVKEVYNRPKLNSDISSTSKSCGSESECFSLCEIGDDNQGKGNTENPMPQNLCAKTSLDLKREASSSAQGYDDLKVATKETHVYKQI